jgi:hypothetical protein
MVFGYMVVQRLLVLVRIFSDALFPPQEVSPWIAWKIRSTGVGIATRLWDQREQLCGEYGDVHGTDRARWPPPVLSSAGRYR